VNDVTLFVAVYLPISHYRSITFSIRQTMLLLVLLTESSSPCLHLFFYCKFKWVGNCCSTPRL